MKKNVFLKLLILNWLYCVFFPAIAFLFIAIGISFITDRPFILPSLSEFDFKAFIFFGIICSVLSTVIYVFLYKTLRYDAGKHNMAIRTVPYLIYGPILSFLVLFSVNSGSRSGGRDPSLLEDIVSCAQLSFYTSPVTILVAAPIIAFSIKCLRSTGMLQGGQS